VDQTFNQSAFTINNKVKVYPAELHISSDILGCTSAGTMLTIKRFQTIRFLSLLLIDWY
jgi:hypothetical protein